MNIRKCCAAAGLAGLLISASLPVKADNFSFTGNLNYDNDVQLFSFTVGAGSPDVVLRTWSYAGGVNAANQTIAEGGFDPILALFDSAGTLINQNDDGGALVPADSVTGAHYDTYLDAGALAAGNYTVSVMQYSNFANGPALANGFEWDGVANQWFRNHWYDVTDHERDSHWAFDILGVAAAVEQQPGVPDGGSSLILLGSAIGALALVRRRMLK